MKLGPTEARQRVGGVGWSGAILDRRRLELRRIDDEEPVQVDPRCGQRGSHPGVVLVALFGVPRERLVVEFQPGIHIPIGVEGAQSGNGRGRLHGKRATELYQGAEPHPSGLGRHPFNDLWGCLDPPLDLPAVVRQFAQVRRHPGRLLGLVPGDGRVADAQAGVGAFLGACDGTHAIRVGPT